VTGIFKLVQAFFGLQLGGKAFSEIVFLEYNRACDTFASGEFEFDAKMAATAGPKTGAQAKTEYRNGILAFVPRKGGLMAGLSVGGQKFSFEAQ
jgi:lipid-binding SYLF domain-containing protein